MSLKENLSNRRSWIRGLYILLFALFYSIAEIVLWAVVIVQFGSRLITGESNERLLEFSGSLNRYVFQILQFITYRSEFMPFPFAEWPETEVIEEEDVVVVEEAEVLDSDEEGGPDAR